VGKNLNVLKGDRLDDVSVAVTIATSSGWTEVSGRMVLRQLPDF
jgi:hypothetical protein